MTAIAQFGMPAVRVAPVPRERGVTFHTYCPRGELKMETTAVELDAKELKAFQDFNNDRICRAELDQILSTLQL